MISSAQLVADLRKLGVGARSALMVHASLRKLGPVYGGAATVILALREALGRDGTLVMPLGPDDAPGFDARNTPVEKDMGVLAEVFRTSPATQVGDHVAGRFGAQGPGAIKLVEPVPLHDYYGPGSPLERFTALDGHVLRLGADENTITLTHWAEYLAEVPNKRRVIRRYVRADSGEQLIESLDDSDGIAPWPHGDYFAQLWREFRANGPVQVGAVGNCTAELFAAQPYVRFAVSWMESHL